MTDKPAPASPDYRGLAEAVAKKLNIGGLISEGWERTIVTAYGHVLRSVADAARGEIYQMLDKERNRVAASTKNDGYAWGFDRATEMVRDAISRLEPKEE